VALIGCAVGLGPVAAVTALRNVFPNTVIPGERLAMALVVLVPASFAWAIVAHRIFDFRVALRAAAVTLVIGGAAAVAYGLGEWWASGLNDGPGSGLAGGALALVALTASLAGPAAPLLRPMGARLVPDDDTSLAGWMHERRSVGHPAGTPTLEDAERLLLQSCDAVSRLLRLDGCIALWQSNGEVRVARETVSGPEPGPELRARATLLARGGLVSVDDDTVPEDDRRDLAHLGIAWLLPIGDPPRAVLLLGRRLAGSWLSRHEVQELERFAHQLEIALENAELRREATSHGALARELREAGAVQAHLLPQRVPVHPTLDCAAAVLSTEPVGGDYYDFVQAPDRSFTLAVGDVAGHGLPAALVLAHVQALFRSLAETGVSPARILQALNREIAEFEQPEKFVGLVCARVDVRSGRVWIANAGLVPPLVLRRDGRIDEISDGGLLLGVRRDAEFVDVPVDLEADEVVLVHTDGLTKARRGDELFGIDRTRDLLRQSAHRRAVDVLEEMLRTVRGYADGPLDDLTLVVLRQLTAPARTTVGPRRA
jgi:serine phosphatase RsbU (regulator of sigma subunit)